MPMTADDILKLASPWTAPIDDAAPSGVKANEDERYAIVTSEIAKLESPVAGVDWKKVWDAVIAAGTELLQEKSKDLLIASYTAYAMYRRDGLPGLLKGVALQTGLVEGFWPTLYPELKRIKGRVNAVQWFVEKVAQQLKNHKSGPADREALDNLVVIVKRFNASAREKFGDACPAVGPLRENVDRLLMDAGPSPEEAAAQKQADDDAKTKAAEQAAAPPPAAVTAAAPAAPAAPVASAAPVAPAAPPVIAPPVAAPALVPSGPAPTVAAPAAAGKPPADVAEVANWLRDIGTSMATTAGTVRRAADNTPLAYRMMRLGLYLHMTEAPPADASGKTKVPPPNPSSRKQIETIANNQKWAPLIEETESALVQSRFWLDAHRYTAQALASLGDGYAKAREEALRELAVVLRRMPVLVTLQFSDGSPFADAATKSWIESEVLAGGGGGGGGSGPSASMGPVVVVQGGGGAGEEAAIVNEAKKLASSGKAGDAIAMLQSKATSASSEAVRFRYRLGLGQVCLAGGQVPVAKAVFEGLEREVAAHNLEAWEPALASATAEGLVQCHRALAKGGKPIPPEAGVLYDRVCRLDPAAALRLGA